MAPRLLSFLKYGTLEIYDIRNSILTVSFFTKQLKSLILKRQNAFHGNGVKTVYRNAVNRERKACKAKFYQLKVEHMKESNPGVWWKE